MTRKVVKSQHYFCKRICWSFRPCSTWFQSLRWDLWTNREVGSKKLGKCRWVEPQRKSRTTNNCLFRYSCWSMGSDGRKYRCIYRIGSNDEILGYGGFHIRNRGWLHRIAWATWGIRHGGWHLLHILAWPNYYHAATNDIASGLCWNAWQDGPGP